MSSIRFCMSNVGADIYCPRCKQGLDIDEWMTEYGDPIQGQSTERCPMCEGNFKLETDIIVKYYTSL